MQSWNLKNKNIEKTFEFRDFKEAMRFVKAIGKIAEKFNHNPEIKLFDDKKVFVMLTTRPLDKPTEKDYKVAEEINNIEF